MPKRMARVQEEMGVPTMAISTARAYVIARAAVIGEDPEDCDYERVAWEAVVEAIGGIPEGQLTVKEAGERCREIYYEAIRLPLEATEWTLQQRLPWQAVACHIYCLLQREEDDPDAEELEYGWTEWVKDRLKESPNGT